MPQLIFSALALLGLLAPSLVLARVGSVRDMKEFQEYCYRSRFGRESDRVDNPGVGVSCYQPTHLLEAGQCRFSLARMSEKLRKAVKGKDNRTADGKKNKGAYFDKHVMQWRYNFDSDTPDEKFTGRSLYLPKDKVDVVFYRGRYYIVDGHHRWLCSLFRGAPTIPVKVIDDLSDLTWAGFLESMRSESHHYAHWRDHLGRDVEPVAPYAMTNDSNLILARKLVRRVDVSRVAGGLIVDDERSSPDRVFLDVRKDIPFDHFALARALRKAINITAHGILGREVRFEPGEVRDYLTLLEPHLDRHSIDPPLRTYEGRPLHALDPASLETDPYLHLARELLRHVEVTRFSDESALMIDEERGADKFIAVKVNRDIAFFEFEIADALRRHGIIFDERRLEHGLTHRERVNYLKILKLERDRPGSRLQKMLLLDKPHSAGSIDFSDLILKHVKRLGCDRLLDNKAEED